MTDGVVKQITHISMILTDVDAEMSDIDKARTESPVVQNMTTPLPDMLDTPPDGCLY